jgi:hypothetical protein
LTSPTSPTGSEKFFEQLEKWPHLKRLFFWIHKRAPSVLQQIIIVVFRFILVVGMLGLALQSFFSISNFFEKLSSVPGLTAIAQIHPAFFTAAAIMLMFYSLFVENIIYYPYIRDLLEKYLHIRLQNRPAEAETPQAKVDRLILEKQALESKIATLKTALPARVLQRLLEALQPQTEPLPHPSWRQQLWVRFKSWLTRRIAPIVRACERLRPCLNPIAQFLKPPLHLIHLVLAHMATVFILLLRAITSIGPTMLGIEKAAAVIALVCGVAIPGAQFLVLWCVIAALGYAIKSAQNLEAQYVTLLNYFGIHVQLRQTPERQADELEKEISALKGMHVALEKAAHEQTIEKQALILLATQETVGRATVINEAQGELHEIQIACLKTMLTRNWSMPSKRAETQRDTPPTLPLNDPDSTDFQRDRWMRRC